MVRFVVTGSLSEEDPVARYDDDTVLVSASLPTRPSTYPDKQSQFQAVRAFINEERVAKGLSPMGSRPTFATEEEIKAQIEAEQSASE